VVPGQVRDGSRSPELLRTDPEERRGKREVTNVIVLPYFERLIVPAVLALLLVLALAPRAARGDDWTDMVGFSGYLESDIRYIVDDFRGAVANDGYKFEMNRNDVDLRLDIQPFDDVKAVIEGRLRLYGFNESASLPELLSRDAIDPYSLYLDEAYIFARGIIWDWLDLKVGRMVQNWGAADQFNPTDNLNSRDLNDPLDYSRKVPNQMIELDIYPTDWLSLNVVWAPAFKPAQLPPSAVLGFAIEYGEDGCFKSAPTPPLKPADNKKVFDLFEESGINLCRLNFVDPEVRTTNPELTMANSQVAVKANFMTGPLDFSFSYYRGRFGFPVPYTAMARVEMSEEVPGDFDVKYVAEVLYPRMHVAGADFAYSADWLGGLGIVGELGVYFPEEVVFGMRTIGGKELGLDEDLALTNVVVESKPFIKATAGLDYTFTSWFYFNAMYVHGFFDEFNDAYGLHNYVVGAMDFKMFDDELQVRLAGVLDIDDLSATLNPYIKWIPYPAAEVTLAALIFFGDTQQSDQYDYSSKSKFGQKAAGRRVVQLKGRLTW